MKAVSILFFALFSISVVAVSVKITDPAECYLQPETTTQINLVVEGLAKGKLAYQIENYAGKVVADGSVAVSNKKATLKLKLPAGHYVCLFQKTNQRFGIYVSPSFTGVRDPFYGIDTAFSWLAAGKKKVLRNSLIKVLADAGIGNVRERIMWNQVNPQKGKYDFNRTHNEYQTLREMFEKYEIKVLDVFHDSPKWLKSMRGPYPADLIETSQSWLNIAEKYSPFWCGFEVWNEPDIGFGGKLPAEYYMPLVKTLSYTFRKHNISTPLLGGIFTDRCPESFRAVCADSGLLKCVDAISFHHYGDWSTLSKFIKMYQQWIAHNGAAGMPLWITESGHWRKKEKDYPRRNADCHVAKQIVLKAVEAKALGVEKFFPFIFGSFAEGQASFSMLCRDYAPLRTCAAYFTNIRLLSNKTYAGDLKEHNYSLCRVFKSGNECVIVFAPKDHKNVSLPVAGNGCLGIDGRLIKVDKNTTINVPDGVLYQLASWSQVKDRVNSRASGQTFLTVVASNAGKGTASPVVLTPGTLETKNSFFQDVCGYTITPEGKELTYTFYAVNLSEKSVNIALDIKQNDFINNLGDSSLIAGVKPYEKKEFRLTFSLKEKLDLTKHYLFKINGKVGNTEILPLALSLTFTGDKVKRASLNSGQAFEPDFLNAECWKANMSSNTTLDIMKSATQTLDISASMSGNGWFFPELKLKKRLWVKSAVMMRLKSEAVKAHIRLMLVYKDGTIFMTRPLSDNDGKWKRIVLAKDDFNHYSPVKKKVKLKQLDFSKVTKIRFGANTCGDKTIKIELADLLFFKQDK